MSMMELLSQMRERARAKKQRKGSLPWFCTTNLPYFLSSEISAISILGLLKSNTILVPPYGFLYVEGVSFCPVFDKKQDIS